MGEADQGRRHRHGVSGADGSRPHGLGVTTTRAATRPHPKRQREESEEAEERSAPTGRVVYKAILSEGESELERASAALFWSGLAAGLSMGFSMFGEGLLHDLSARRAVAAAGLAASATASAFSPSCSAASSCSPRTR